MSVPCPPPAPPALPALPRAELIPLGDAAIVLRFGEVISAATHRAIRAFDAYLAQHPFAGLRECVPAFTTLTVYYDPWRVSEQGRFSPCARAAELLRQRLAAAPPADELPAADLVEIPVCYGGSFGPDLAFVAAHAGLSSEEVIALHAEPDYLVHLIGFAPGFPYLGGLDARLNTPRQAAPRALVPAGSVGIAGPQTGIYSLPTPGGWQLIGRTDLAVFDLSRDPAALLRPGVRVRFVDVGPTVMQR